MAFYLAHSNSDSAVLPRSEVPKNFIPAQATARVTTFSFPLFILSGAPPGRLLKPVDCVTAAPGASESHTWKIASPGGVERRTAYPFGQPRSGVRRQAYRNADETSSVFLSFFVQYFSIPALSCCNSRLLETKNYFQDFDKKGRAEVQRSDYESLPTCGEGLGLHLRLRRMVRAVSASRLRVATDGPETMTAK